MWLKSLKSKPALPFDNRLQTAIDAVSSQREGVVHIGRSIVRDPLPLLANEPMSLPL